ncbi:MAG: TM1802 family CRISPR-associated protein [Candidatus Competibacteraceae bacterium]
MISEMRELALLDLNHRFGCNGLTMEEIRKQYGKELAPLLVEASEKIARVYLLQEIPGKPGTVRMWSEELDEDKKLRLPFNKPSGAQSPAIGPVFKRTFKKDAQPPFGPTVKIQDTTRGAFEEQSKSKQHWSTYFAAVCKILFNSTDVIFDDKVYKVGQNKEDPHILAIAIRLIPDRQTVFLSVVDNQGRWPGDCQEYSDYLAHSLAGIKYTTGEAAAYESAVCPLCGDESLKTLYPNALKGAGLNFSNVDRAGAFPSLETADAWKSYGLCLDCADLLYIFKNHLLNEFIGSIAGEKALLLPSLLGNQIDKKRFITIWKKYLNNLKGESNRVKSWEGKLMEFFSEQDDAQLVLQVLWAKFGQVVEDVRGHVTDILPSRLQKLIDFNKSANNWNHALAPAYPLEEATFDLTLSMFNPSFKRPGGKRAGNANNSVRLFELKRQLADALYHGQALGETRHTLWKELMTTARWYLDEIIAGGNSWGLLNEGISEKGDKQTRYWTLAGWVRHLARFLYYLDITGILPMEQTPFVFEPQMEALKPFFKPGSGINSREKAFTFLLGILYGKLLQVQGARGVNVSSNALTWLRRLELSGRDLPELYTKVREKLLAYETESNPEVRALIHDLGRLGAILGDKIALDSTATCYFLLLGQSVTTEVLPSKPKKEED